jgi:hypothetical protein
LLEFRFILLTLLFKSLIFEIILFHQVAVSVSELVTSVIFTNAQYAKNVDNAVIEKANQEIMLCFMLFIKFNLNYKIMQF